MSAFQSLDTPSIALVIFLIATMLAIGMTVLWRWGKTERGFGFWVAAQWALSIGMLALFARAVVPLWISVAIGNALLFMTMVFVRIGLARFRELDLSIWPDLAIAGLITTALALNAATGGHIENRIALIGATMAFLALRCASALHGMNGPLRVVRQFAQSVMMLIATLMVIRGWIAAVGDSSGSSLFEVGLAGATIFLSVAVATVALLFILVALNSARTLELLQRERDSAETASETDALTGLLNRRGLFRMIEDLDSSRLVGVCLIDLDHFKKVNDSHGHDVGDQVLTVLAALMKESAPDCLSARLGGEEFVMVIPDADRTQTLEQAEKLRVAVARELGLRSGLEQRITTSIGTCAGPKGRFSELLTSADLALYRAKSAGRDRTLGAGPGETSQTPSGRRVRHRSTREPA